MYGPDRIFSNVFPLFQIRFFLIYTAQPNFEPEILTTTHMKGYGFTTITKTEGIKYDQLVLLYKRKQKPVLNILQLLWQLATAPKTYCTFKNN